MTWPCCDECWTKGLEKTWSGLGFCDEDLTAGCQEKIADREWWANAFIDRESSADAQNFFMNMLTGCCRMEHKICVMSMINVIPNAEIWDVDWLGFILSDMEMTHALQSKTNFINQTYWCGYAQRYVKKLTVDVYRYIVSRLDNTDHAADDFATITANHGNVEVFNYILTNEFEKLSEEALNLIPAACATSCLGFAEGARCVETALKHNVCDKEAMSGAIKTRLEATPEGPCLRKNLAQLVQKGYICGSEFCYSIDA